jgi:hypothetical protein
MITTKGGLVSAAAEQDHDTIAPATSYELGPRKRVTCGASSEPSAMTEASVTETPMERRQIFAGPWQHRDRGTRQRRRRTSVRCQRHTERR